MITLILAGLGPAMAPLPLPLRTLLLSVRCGHDLTRDPVADSLFRDWLTPVH